MTIACTLTSAQLRARRAHISALAGTALRSRVSIAHGARLTFDPSAELPLRELVTLERQCCPFLTLALRPAGDALELVVTGPDEAAPMITELFR
jgi:hypothetical protein